MNDGLESRGEPWEVSNTAYAEYERLCYGTSVGSSL